MEPVIRWQASDGVIFVTQQDCRLYEDLCSQIVEVMAHLPPRPEDHDFFNGNRYLKHCSSKVNFVRRKLQAIMDDSRKEKHERFLNDGPFRKAWHRLLCIDQKWREWGQQYFVDYPKENAKEVKVG